MSFFFIASELFFFCGLRKLLRSVRKVIFLSIFLFPSLLHFVSFASPTVNILPTVSISSSLNKIEGLRTGYAGDRSSTSTIRLLDFYKANRVSPRRPDLRRDFLSCLENKYQPENCVGGLKCRYLLILSYFFRLNSLKRYHT